MKKSIGVIVVIIMAICCFVLAGFIILSSNFLKNFSFNFGDFNFDWIEESENLVEHKEYAVNDIYIEGDVVNVFIDQSDDVETVEVEFYSDDEEDEYVFKQDDNKINLKIINDDEFGFHKNNRLIVKIPYTFENKLVVDVEVGNIEIGDFAYLKPDVKVNTGNIEVECVDELSAKVNIGNIEVDAINRLKAKCDTGNVKVARLNNKADIEVAVGDVKLEDVTLTDESNIKVNMGNIKIEELDGAYVDASSGVGEVKVHKNDNNADVTLKVRTEVGDIKINY